MQAEQKPRTPGTVPVEMTARYSGKCSSCRRSYKAGTRIIWSPADRITYHLPDQCGTYTASQAPRGTKKKRRRKRGRR